MISNYRKEYFSKRGIPLIEGKYKLKQTRNGEGRKFHEAERKLGITIPWHTIYDHPRHDGHTTILSPYFYSIEPEDDKEGSCGAEECSNGLLILKEFCDKAGFSLSVYTESIYSTLTTDFVIQY